MRGLGMFTSFTSPLEDVCRVCRGKQHEEREVEGTMEPLDDERFLPPTSALAFLHDALEYQQD